MSDGFVIMLIGMGVVFLFLLILMLFIRIVASPGTNEKDQDQAVMEKSGVLRPRGINGHDDSMQEKEEGIKLAAAVAVALELERREKAGFVFAPARSAESAWSLAGRMALHRGMAGVRRTLSARRGHN